MPSIIARATDIRVNTTPTTEESGLRAVEVFHERIGFHCTVKTWPWMKRR